MKYSFDVYRFEIEKEKDSISLEISNIISWDLLKIKLSESEFKSFVAFLNECTKNI